MSNVKSPELFTHHLPHRNCSQFKCIWADIFSHFKNICTHMFLFGKMATYPNTVYSGCTLHLQCLHHFLKIQGYCSDLCMSEEILSLWSTYLIYRIQLDLANTATNCPPIQLLHEGYKLIYFIDLQSVQIQTIDMNKFRHILVPDRVVRDNTLTPDIWTQQLCAVQ